MSPVPYEGPLSKQWLGLRNTHKTNTPSLGLNVNCPPFWKGVARGTSLLRKEGGFLTLAVFIPQQQVGVQVLRS